jgi:outer membrane protein OmpA-like peptidoglycan-associated protein
MTTILLLTVVGVMLGSVPSSVRAEEQEGKSVTDRLSSLEKRLESVGEKRPLLAPTAVTAGARLGAVREYLAENPDDEGAELLVATCSLLVEAATLEAQAMRSRTEASGLRDSIKAALVHLSEIHEDILEAERGRASELKSSLDAERRKAEKLKHEAERRFNELQSELINVKQDARGTIISMSDILFDIGKATLTADLKTNLAKIAGILTIFKDSKVIVEGHTDNQGSAGYNQQLSEKRALHVLELLTEQGVAPERLTAVGYGFTRPVADNETKEGRQKNRRVDLVVQDPRRTPPKAEVDEEW